MCVDSNPRARVFWSSLKDEIQFLHGPNFLTELLVTPWGFHWTAFSLWMRLFLKDLVFIRVYVHQFLCTVSMQVPSEAGRESIGGSEIEDAVASYRTGVEIWLCVSSRSSRCFKPSEPNFHPSCARSLERPWEAVNMRAQLSTSMAVSFRCSEFLELLLFFFFSQMILPAHEY